MTARLLMIALDGADGVLLDRWSADGTLPSLAALRARSVVRRLSAPAGISDDALWASFQFAAPLGEHGRYHWEQRLASGEMGMAYEDERDRESFWTALSRRGNRVAILDVPKCGPPQAINGIHLVDWLVHGRYFPEPRSAPETLAASVVAQFGPAPPSYCAYEGPPLADAEVHEVTANLRTSVARKRAAALHYLASEPWDLFIVAFKEAHCAGHHLWDLSDPRHPGFDAARNERLGDPLRTIFRDLDAAVGDLVSAAGPEAAVAVFSTSDMAPNGTLIHYAGHRRPAERGARRDASHAGGAPRAATTLDDARAPPVRAPAVQRELRRAADTRAGRLAGTPAGERAQGSAAAAGGVAAA